MPNRALQQKAMKATKQRSDFIFGLRMEEHTRAGLRGVRRYDILHGSRVLRENVTMDDAIRRYGSTLGKYRMVPV